MFLLASSRANLAINLLILLLGWKQGQFWLVLSGVMFRVVYLSAVDVYLYRRDPSSQEFHYTCHYDEDIDNDEDQEEEEEEEKGEKGDKRGYYLGHAPIFRYNKSRSSLFGLTPIPELTSYDDDLSLVIEALYSRNEDLIPCDIAFELFRPFLFDWGDPGEHLTIRKRKAAQTYNRDVSRRTIPVSKFQLFDWGDPGEGHLITAGGTTEAIGSQSRRSSSVWSHLAYPVGSGTHRHAMYSLRAITRGESRELCAMKLTRQLYNPAHD